MPNQAENKKILASLGARIQFVRTKAGLSQADLAEKLDFSTSAVISRFERDERPPSVDSLIKLSELFKIDLHWLITGQPSPMVFEIQKRIKPFFVTYLHFIAKELAHIGDGLCNLREKCNLSESERFEVKLMEDRLDDYNKIYQQGLEQLDEITNKEKFLKSIREE